MSFTLARQPRLSPHAWLPYTNALRHAIHHINGHNPTIFGPNGNGPPIITPQFVTFNGNRLAHRWWNKRRLLTIDPEERDDAHEDHRVHRELPSRLTGMHYQGTETYGKPYSLAVRVSYLLLRHYFPAHTLIVAADATREQWMLAFSYGRIVEPDLMVPPECKLLLANLELSDV